MQRTSISVLLVDDDPSFRKLIERYLQELPNWKIHCDTCENSDHAVQFCKSMEYDTILIDYILNKETGLDTIKALKELNVNAPMIILTGLSDEKAVIEALRSGAYDYLKKDEISLQILNHTLYKVVERNNIQKELRKHQQHLEDLVRDRTEDLLHIIKRLQDEFSVRKQTESLLEETSNFNQKLITSIPLGMCTFRSDGTCISANQYIANVLELPIESLINNNIRNIPQWKHTELVDILDSVLKSAIETKIDIQTWTMANKEIWLECILSHFVAKGEDHILLLVNDISPRKQIERDLISAKEKAEESNKLKNQFLANMSHEFRTPMNTILGMTDLVLDSNLDNDQKEYLNSVKVSANNLLNLLMMILDYSKIEAGDFNIENTLFTLSDCLDRAILPYMKMAYQKNIDLSIFIKQNIPPILMGDVMRIQQIVGNIVKNAVQFTEKGAVVLTVQKYAESHEIPHDYSDENILLIFTVSDTGIGISEEMIQKIFNPFMQGDGSATRKIGGLGMGLALSKKIIEKLKGKIWAESKLNLGSKFHFLIPLKVISVHGNTG